MRPTEYLHIATVPASVERVVIDMISYHEVDVKVVADEENEQSHLYAKVADLKHLRNEVGLPWVLPDEVSQVA